MDVRTISTHMGHQAHRSHNIRSYTDKNRPENIYKEYSGLNEILVDEEPRAAYDRIFGDALKDYNTKTKNYRRIDNYYDNILGSAGGVRKGESKKNKKWPVYEMIIQVGDMQTTGYNDPMAREILKEFVDTWSERNPNMELIGAYLHADEGCLHIHTDFVPVAHGYKNGMHTQNGLNQALVQQGFEFKSHKDTPQIQWIRAQNEALEKICNAHDVTVDHPQRGQKVKHLNQAEYNNKKAAEALDKKTEEFEKTLEDYNGLKDSLDVRRKEIKREIDRAELILENNDVKYKPFDIKTPAEDVIALKTIIKSQQQQMLELDQIRAELAKASAKSDSLDKISTGANALAEEDRKAAKQLIQILYNRGAEILNRQNVQDNDLDAYSESAKNRKHNNYKPDHDHDGR